MKTCIIFNQFDKEKVFMTKELVYELVRRGNIVIYYSGLANKDLITRLGAEFREYPVICKPYFQDNKLSQLMINKERIQMHELIEQRLISEVLLERPTCIIYDSDCVFAKAISQKHQIPAISLISGFALTNEQISQLQLSQDRKIDKVKRYISEMVLKIDSVSNPLESEETQFETGYADLNLVCTFKSLQPYASLLNETFHYVGFPVDYGTTALETVDWRSLKRPFVYVSMSKNRQLSKDLFQILLDFDGTVILDLAPIQLQLELETLPKHIIPLTYNLSENDWEHLDLLISDAGLNLIHLAIKHAIPMLNFPKTPSQGLIAARIEECSLGLCSDLFNHELIKDHIELLLTYERYKANMTLFASLYGESGCGRKMVLEIEKYLRSIE